MSINQTPTPKASRAVLWFRRDLRLTDNMALVHALADTAEVLPVFIWAPEEEELWAPGGAGKVWLHYSLESLLRSLQECGSTLCLRQGNSEEQLLDVARSVGATHIYWNRLYDPALIERDKKIKDNLKREGFTVASFNSALLVEPWEIKTGGGGPYQVYTPFWKTVSRSYIERELHSAPSLIRSPRTIVKSSQLTDFQLLPEVHWDRGIKESWNIGEHAALKQLKNFETGSLAEYTETRNLPGTAGTSRLSPHLHFGEIGPAQIWTIIKAARQQQKSAAALASLETFLKEIVWREFAHHLLFHFPQTTSEPLREKFKTFPWEENPGNFTAWTKGQTGYPIVDAGMRELWHTGWMHNRVRMIVASFLVKHLLIPWQKGAAWFWDTLVDADLASNTLGWQWTAGCGADAAPYFRVFNPILQGEKFDGAGGYVRRWVPEIAALPDRWLHRPWEAPEDELVRASIKIGVTYPLPIVDHGEARERALDAYEEIR